MSHACAHLSTDLCSTGFLFYSTAGIEFFASTKGGNELVPGTESDFTIKLTNNAQYQVVSAKSDLQRQ